MVLGKVVSFFSQETLRFKERQFSKGLIVRFVKSPGNLSGLKSNNYSIQSLLRKNESAAPSLQTVETSFIILSAKLLKPLS